MSNILILLMSNPFEVPTPPIAKPNIVKRFIVTSLSISLLGLSGIKMHEGFSGTAYKDVTGVWTIGYGNAQNVKPTDTISREDASNILQRMVDDNYARGIQRCIKVPLTQHEFDALVDLAYNAGVGGACSSPVVELVNQGHYEQACAAYIGYKVNNRKTGLPIKGLQNRREYERTLCLKP